jgi:hypothetical protein
MQMTREYTAPLNEQQKHLLVTLGVAAESDPMDIDHADDKNTTPADGIQPVLLDLLRGGISTLPCLLQVLETKAIGGGRARVVVSDGVLSAQALLYADMATSFLSQMVPLSIIQVSRCRVAEVKRTRVVLIKTMKFIGGGATLAHGAPQMAPTEDEPGARIYQ